MKKMIVGIFCLFALTQTVKADEFQIEQDECLAAGDVQLTMSRMIESVCGRIGTTEIRLMYLNGVIYGNIQGLDTKLYIRGKRVVGTAGMNKINWAFNRQTAVITGFQKCLKGTITD